MPASPAHQPRPKAALVTAAAAAAVLACTQLVLPGSTGRGTPAAVLFSGLVFGSVNALIAAGLVLIYRAHRFINFAQAALGTLGGVFTYNLMALLNVPFPLAFAAGVAVAALAGLIVDVTFVWRFFHAPRLVLTVFTIVLIPLTSYLGPVLRDALPIFPSPEDRTLDDLTGQNVPIPFEGFTFQVGSFPLQFDFTHLFAVGAGALALLALAVFLRRTRIGVAVRASADNAERARLLGISVHRISIVVWTIAGALAGVAVISESMVRRQFAFEGAPAELLFVPLAAAVVAKMRSLPIAVAAAVGISVLWNAFRFSYEQHTALLWVGGLAVIVVALLLQAEHRGRSEESATSSWKTTEEPRPVPKEMAAIPGIQLWKRAALSLLAVTVVLYPWVVTPRQTSLGGYLLIVAMVMVSLVVLTGWAGQVSLGQFAFVAIGAVLGGAMTSTLGISFWVALLVVPVITAAVTVVIGLPALRIHGLFLAVATFAFAVAVERGLTHAVFAGRILPDAIERPHVFMLDFEDERSMYYLLLVCLAVTVVAVVSLRRSRIGRVLIGIRENENNARAFGVNPVHMRLFAFGVSGFICGFAGHLLAHHQRAVTDAEFAAEASLQVFLFAVVGGVGSVFGVLLGAAYFAIMEFVTFELFQFLFGPVLIAVILFVAPGGLTQISMGLRDGVLRIIAQRRQMVVPSLFADFDPEVAERKLIPLSEPIAGHGADTLPADRRYRRESELYGTRGRPDTARRRVTEEATAITAAARAAQDGDGIPEPVAETGSDG